MIDVEMMSLAANTVTGDGIGADTVAQVLVALLAVVGAAFQVRRGGRSARSEVKENIELLGMLPESSGVKAELLAHIDASIRKLIGEESDARRDPVGIGLGLFFLLGAAASFVAGLRGSNWRFAVAALVGVLGAVGFPQAMAKTQRDAKGNPVK